MPPGTDKPNIGLESIAHSFFNPMPSEDIPIEQMPIRRIMLLSEQNEAFESKCKSATLDSFWEKKLEGLFGGSFRPQRQEGIDVFTQFRGQYYYNSAVIAKESTMIHTGKTPNLLKAIKYYSFDAIFCMMKTTHNKNSLSHTLALLSHLNPQSATPALLLYARTYLHFALTSKDSPPPALIGLYLDQAYIFLYLAEKQCEKSSTAIYNATYGRGLQRIFPEFTSFANARDAVARLIESNGQIQSSYHLSSLIDKARDTLDKLMDKAPLANQTSWSPC